jgi:hypothetical protein
MRILVPLALIAALAATALHAQEEKTAEAVVPAIDAVSPSTESATATETDAPAQTSASESAETPAEESAPPEIVSESQE